METVFKVGMKVWDKTISPNKGKVIEVLEDTKFDFPIKVEFDDGLKIQYTNKGCFVKSKGAINTLSSSDYSIELEGFEQKAPAPTYEEAVEWFKSDDFKNLHFPDKSSLDKINEQTEALKKLLVLRDYYNEGKVFDRVDFHGGGLYSVTLEDGGSTHFQIKKVYHAEYPFTFWDKKTAEKFMNEQSLLLSIAKPLL